MGTAPRARWMLVLALASLLATIAGAAIAASSDDPESPVSSAPIADDMPPGDAGPQLVEPRPGMAGVYDRPFDSAVVSDDGSSVTIDFISGVEPCNVLDRVDVRYGAAAVTITLFEGHDPNAGDVACIEIGVAKRVIVTLDEPVDGREIRDGAA